MSRDRERALPVACISLSHEGRAGDESTVGESTIWYMRKNTVHSVSERDGDV